MVMSKRENTKRDQVHANVGTACFREAFLITYDGKKLCVSKLCVSVCVKSMRSDLPSLLLSALYCSSLAIRGSRLMAIPP